MSLVYRFLISKAFTLFYSCIIIITIAFQYVIKGFKNPWTQKLRSEPPSNITDPKYGVHKYIKANNIKLHYVESGDSSKPLMLFLHGFPEFWYSWRHQIVEFNKYYRCVAVDMRGYGDSEKPEEVSSYRFDILIEDVRDLIRQLGADKCILVGHDFGGAVACRFRDVYPELLHACIMIGSIAADPWMTGIRTNLEQMLKSWYVFFFQMPVLPEFLLSMNDLYAWDDIAKATKNAGPQDAECYKYWFGKPSAITPPINYYRANFMYESPNWTVKGDVPHLLLNGKKDAYITKHVIKGIEEYYPKIETMVIDAAHFLQMEVPERVNDIIKEFLNKHNVK